mmetsp:Transcript_46761/g.105754  ORF Transcript_46761/g.105754 Transcript_46761/m.105754 type:complete len:222 (-) Transcript_46761:28-693(-)
MPRLSSCGSIGRIIEGMERLFSDDLSGPSKPPWMGANTLGPTWSRSRSASTNVRSSRFFRWKLSTKLCFEKPVTRSEPFRMSSSNPTRPALPCPPWAANPANVASAAVGASTWSKSSGLMPPAPPEAPEAPAPGSESSKAGRARPPRSARPSLAPTSSCATGGSAAAAAVGSSPSILWALATTVPWNPLGIADHALVCTGSVARSAAAAALMVKSQKLCLI